jgi:hypothetical protein
MIDLVDKFSRFNVKSIPIFSGNTVFKCKVSEKNK